MEAEEKKSTDAGHVVMWRRRRRSEDEIGALAARRELRLEEGERRETPITAGYCVVALGCELFTEQLSCSDDFFN